VQDGNLTTPRLRHGKRQEAGQRIGDANSRASSLIVKGRRSIAAFPGMKIKFPAAERE
jgi:hypothetical protein